MKQNKNLLLIYLYSFFSAFLLYRSCDVLYYLEKGISNDIYIRFMTISSITTIIFLVPFGILKDKFNRKKMLLLSNLLLLIAIILYIVANNAIIMGIGMIFSTFASIAAQGIISSLLHNYVTNKKEYSNKFFIWSAFYFGGYSISMVLGGIVAEYSLSRMYYISIIPTIINFIILLLLDDKKEKKKEVFHYKHIIKDALTSIKKSKILLLIIIFDMIIIPVVSIGAETHPEYLANMGASTTLIGIYTAIMCLLGIFGNYIATKIKNDKFKLFLSPLLMFTALIIFGLIHNYSTIIFILLVQVFYSVFDNTSNSIIQDKCNDKSRQTVVAFEEFIIAISQMIISLISSFMFKIFDLGSSYIILGVISIILFVIIDLIFNKTLFKSTY